MAYAITDGRKILFTDVNQGKKINLWAVDHGDLPKDRLGANPVLFETMEEVNEYLQPRKNRSTFWREAKPLEVVSGE